MYQANETNLIENFNRRLQDVDLARAACLAAIEDLLHEHRKSPVDYSLPLANPLLLEPLQDDNELLGDAERKFDNLHVVSLDANTQRLL